ncbi:1-deoxy-D-xylulose-5-phosphate reductoisomerase [Sphingomonas sp.]|uniref:1-deoxy-D-xylulose-5-phosphate reductoisomerase n=1 Tax=Sphingomonas sp. TaxID=28214 RepID=UPI0025EB5ECF|nr:1-deoxy-D-xylulose-5-phosphate reductoisomerase [Sphingomonas sp.]
MQKSVSILGATGSVGQSTLDLVLRAPERFEVLALTANRDVTGLAKAARATRAKLAVIADPLLHGELTEALTGTTTEIASGPDAITEAATRGADWTMAAIVGCAGLPSTMAALKCGRTVAFANKESLVSAGPLMIRAAHDSAAVLLPVDSEHNAIFQCLAGDTAKSVRKIILTASGGPFRTSSLAEMASATPETAVKHPNWSMGAKISIDSATMMNKGLELIEAHYLFAIESARLGVVFHPQSVVHSMVEYIDGSVLAQMGSPDMRIPIASTLAWPDRMATGAEPLDLAAIGRLDFEEPDLERFPALTLARDALEAGGARPAVLNAANEIAVAAFLARRVGFLTIADVVKAVLERYDPANPATIEDVLAIDAEARRVAETVMRGLTA